MAEHAKVFAAITPPVEPLTSAWEVSAVELIRRAYDVPSMASKALGQLDRFGALRLTPDCVGIDNDDVSWRKITALRTRGLREVLTQSALDREIIRLRKALPPIPGRKWVLEKAASSLGELCQAALDRAGNESLSRHVVSEIEYRGSLGRSRTLAGGFVVTAVLGLVPEANRILLSTAEERGGARVEVGQ